MTSTSAERNLLPRVVVVGLGPAGPDLLTAGTLDAIGAASRRFLRTRRHPAAVAVPAAEDFDAVYEASASFDEVYRSEERRVGKKCVRTCRSRGSTDP